MKWIGSAGQRAGIRIPGNGHRAGKGSRPNLLFSGHDFMVSRGHKILGNVPSALRIGPQIGASVTPFLP